MNSCQAKKFRERFYLDCFLEKLALSPSSVEEKEPPDFLLCLNGRLVGVEVTYLHIRESREGGLLQVEESVTDKIVSEARSRYLESGGSPTHVTVLFSGGLNPKAVRRSEAAAFICEQVRRMSLRPMERGDWRSDANDNWNHPFADVVHLIHALGVPDHKMGHWSVARAGWVGFDSALETLDIAPVVHYWISIRVERHIGLGSFTHRTSLCRLDAAVCVPGWTVVRAYKGDGRSIQRMGCLGDTSRVDEVWQARRDRTTLPQRGSALGNACLVMDG